MILSQLECMLVTAGVQVKLWDTGNMERHGSMATSYFRHAVGVILVYSKADQDSLHSLRDWIDNSLDLNMWNQDKITFTVWGNEVESSDMVTGPTRVENGVVKQLIASTDIRVEDDLYCTVNSKTGAGVMESYRKLIAAVDAMIREDSRSYSTYTAAAAAPSTPTVVLANTSTENTRKKRCFC